jgi:hypothetical protein
MGWYFGCLGSTIVSLSERRRASILQRKHSWKDLIATTLETWMNMLDASLFGIMKNDGSSFSDIFFQSYEDEFALPDIKKPAIPADGGQILMPCKAEDGLSPEKQKMFRSGTGKLLHMMQWLRPEILNSVRELSRNMQVALVAHLKKC